MTPEAIAKLRRKFIALAMLSFFVVIAFMCAMTAVVNVGALVGQANATIDAILDAGGDTPHESNFRNSVFHEEAVYGLRFFTVSYDKAGNVTKVDLSHVMLVDQEQALAAAEQASDPDILTGLSRYENYLYKEGIVGNGSMVVFLDCSAQIANAQDVIYRILLFSLIGFGITAVIIVFTSRWAIRPEVENVRRQQQFMTNASHELKTPISVIRANTELTEMMSGETEWTQSTLRQVDRLEGLVRNLMVIVRGEEQSSAEQGVTTVDVSKVVGDAVESFKAPAQQKGLELTASISEGVTLLGNANSVEQLTCLLVDNSIKYCDPNGHIDVKLSKALGRGCTLVVTNDFAAGRDVDYQRFFERFYREDESHENQQGYGIGLSVANSICERHHGSIKASWKAGSISFTCTLKHA